MSGSYKKARGGPGAIAIFICDLFDIIGDVKVSACFFKVHC